MAEEQLPKPGDLVGVRYRIESMLGQGGMGAVFAAVNQATGRAVAIKWMLPGAARSQESLARFLSEARATAKIEHPNVIQILDVGQDGACPFLVMERLRGSSLADRLAKGRLSVAETVSVMLAACRGVAEAHNEGILHRDLKPDNIFHCQVKDGSPRPPKVLDFGISKLYEEGGGPSLTRTGMAMGTPQYMSPEQLSALPDMDGRLDVYAMGVVLYECLTGRPPYTADGLFELVQQIAAGNPTPIRFVAPDVPPDLEAIVMRAMTGNRDHRYPSMRDLIAALEQVSQRLQSGAPAPHIPQPHIPQNHIPPTAGHSAPGTGPVSGGPWAGQGGYATPPQGGGYMTPAQGGFGPPSQQYGYPPSGSQAMPPATAGFGAPAGQSSSRLPLIAGAGCVALLLLTIGIGAVAYVVSDDDSTPDVANNGVGGPLDTGNILNTGNTTTTPSNSRTPTMGLTFSGDCTPRFTSRVMVTGSTDSLTVLSSGLAGVSGSITLMLPGINGTTNISSQQRIDTQTVINVMAGQQIWTNLTMDSVAVANGRIPDPISGSITVTEFDPELARCDLTFHNVTLQHMQNGGICTVNGRLQTFGTTYGM
jgi:serine/threonine-protein kinase